MSLKRQSGFTTKVRNLALGITFMLLLTIIGYLTIFVIAENGWGWQALAIVAFIGGSLIFAFWLENQATPNRNLPGD